MPEALFLIALGATGFVVGVVIASIRAERRYKKWKLEHEIKSFDTR